MLEVIIWEFLIPFLFGFIVSWIIFNKIDDDSGCGGTCNQGRDNCNCKDDT